MTRSYLTTTIPYVNARPHLGFALELVQADVLARHRRHLGDEVRLLSGTDDNSLKNVLAAEAEGIKSRPLSTAMPGRSPRCGSRWLCRSTISSAPAATLVIASVWSALARCDESGDLYRKHYEGLYCVGCEQFYTRTNSSTADVPSTAPSLNWSPRRTGSSACPGTPTPCTS